MPKAYSATGCPPIRIHGVGETSQDTPLEISPKVARDVEKDKRIRVEWDEPRPRLAPKLKPTKEKE